MQICTISKGDSKVSFCPERGGIITSIILKGKEILYMDEFTFDDLSKNVRGGIPILFPNAGILDERQKEYGYDLKQHGFARVSKRKLVKCEGSKFVESLDTNDDKDQIFDFKFELRLVGEILEDESVYICLYVKNIGKEKMPISLGLHPYFKIDSKQKKNIKFDFIGGNIVTKNFDDWSNGLTTYVDKSNGELSVNIPGIGNLIMNIDSKFTKLRIRSQLDKDFVCIEPMMNGLNGLIDNPCFVNPDDEVEMEFSIKLN